MKKLSPKKSPKKSPVKEDNTKLKDTAKKDAPKTIASKDKKDPNEPKKPNTSFSQYCFEQRKIMKRKNPTLTWKEITKELGLRWKTMDPETKEGYQKMADKRKKQYDIDMAAYKKNNPKVKLVK